MYAPNMRVPLTYMKQILTYLKGEIDNNTILGEFSTPHLAMDNSSDRKFTGKYCTWTIH